MQKRTFFLFIIILQLTSVFAREISFEKIDMTSGLSHNSALCLLEDHEGFIWIGTRDGLNKFDGVNFEIYKHVFFDTSSLPNDQVNCIYETKNHEIWVGTANGLCRYSSKKNRFSRFDLAPTVHSESEFIRSIFECSNGELWVGTTSGLHIIDSKHKTSKFILLRPETEHLANNIQSIFQDNKGVIWLGTRSGLFRYTGKKFDRIQLLDNGEKDQPIIRDIVENNEGLLWLATEAHGIYVLNNRNEKPLVQYELNTANQILPSNTVRSIFFANKENVWIGTFGGLCIYHPELNRAETYNFTNSRLESFSNNSVRDILRDSQGGFWVALYLGGVNYYHPQKNMFRKIGLNKAGYKNHVSMVSVLLEDSQNNLWLGTEGNGIYFANKNQDSFAEYLKFSDVETTENTIKSMVLQKYRLWVGTIAGLNSVNIKTKQIEKFRYNSYASNSIHSGHVLALLAESNNRIWVGTNGGGVQILNVSNNSFSDVRALKNLHVRCFFKDSKRRIWVGNEEGVFLCENTSDTLTVSKINNKTIGITDVTFINEDSKQNIWIGTRGRGLFYIVNGVIHWFNTGTGLVDNTVNSLLEGKPNQYWITSNKGLSQLNLMQTGKGLPEISCETYSLNQGVQGLQFSPNCAIKSANGKLYFGGINGLNVFSPNEIMENDYFPKLILTDLSVDYKLIQPGDEDSPLQQSLNDTKEITLKYDQRDFSISFTGINFLNPDKNRYRYMVPEIYDAWIEIGSQNRINFTYFPIGTYEIRIQTSTNSHKWSEIYRSLKVTVLPPWWKTWWAFLIYTFVLVVSLLLFFYYSQRWAKMKNELAMQQFQREKENELHQLKLRFFTDVSHELRSPLTLILAPLENLIAKAEIPNRFRNQLVQIQRSGFRLMQLVNQILDLRKLETGHNQLRVAKGNIVRFLSEINLAFKEIAAAKKIGFEFISHKNELLLWFDRNKLEIIINNLLSNAFKFTPPGGKVLLRVNEISGTEIDPHFKEIHKKQNYVQIQVINYGEGISDNELQMIFKRFYTKNGEGENPMNAGVGLELTRRMVELHKGVISVSSSDNPGNENETIFSVFLPLDKNAYSQKEIDLDFRNSEDLSLYTTEFLQRETLIAANEEEITTVNENPNDDFERLLIIEDNAEVRSFIKEMFADDYEISEAENGEEGLQKAIESNPQLIISDVMMPVMDGIELCRKIKTDARTSHIPVILLTARTALTFKYEGLETGADDYITKPFSVRYLSLRVHNLIEQRHKIHEYFKREALCDPGSVTLTSVDERILKKAMDFITENISDPSLSVNGISEHIGLSRVHFYRKIKALTNQTAVEFIRNIRMKRAATLIEQNKLSIKEIRNLVGFEDADYFRKCFKEQFGVTPSDFHKNHL